MDEQKDVFGEAASSDLKVGDIVEWSTWNTEKSCFDSNYGILIEIKNEIRSNRIISISRVMPLYNPQSEIQLFSLSLRLVSRSKEQQS